MTTASVCIHVADKLDITTWINNNAVCGFITNRLLLNNVGIPYIEVTIAMMVQLNDTSGTIELFETIGGPPRSNHEERE